MSSDSVMMHNMHGCAYIYTTVRYHAKFAQAAISMCCVAWFMCVIDVVCRLLLVHAWSSNARTATHIKFEQD